MLVFRRFLIILLVLVPFLGTPLLAETAPAEETLIEQGLALAYDEKYDEAILTLRKALTVEPLNQDIRLALARVHSWAGDYPTAHAIVDEVLVADPEITEALVLRARLFYFEKSYDPAEAILTGLTGNAEAEELLAQIRRAREEDWKNHLSNRLALARSHSWADDYSTAHAIVDEVLTADPNNSEAKILRARLYFFEKSYDRSEAILTDLIGNADAEELLAQVRQARKEDERSRWSAVVSHEHSVLSRVVQPDWRQTGLGISYRFNDRTTMQFRYDRALRFNTPNDYFELGADLLLSDVVSARVSLGGAANGSFRPTLRAKAVLDWHIPQPGAQSGDAWATLELQHDRFSSGTQITTATPGIRFAPSDIIDIHGKWINTFDNSGRHLSGWSLSGAWQTPWNGLRVNWGVSVVPETEAATTVVTRSWSAGFSYPLGEHATLFATVSQDDRSGSYLRRGASTAILYRF